VLLPVNIWYNRQEKTIKTNIRREALEKLGYTMRESSSAILGNVGYYTLKIR